jgi:short chain dehydrogenase/FRG domain
VEKSKPDDWEKVVQVNLIGTFNVTRLAIPHLKKSSAGVIIIMSSGAGRFGYANRRPYSATKWALIGFTKTLSIERGEFGIRANAILPGAVEGPEETESPRGPLPGSDLESVFNAIYSYSSTKDHRCILAQYDIPPFQLLLRDLVRFHDIARCKNRFILPASPGVAVQNFVESLKTMYVYTFLRANSYLPVLTAILQHYGLPTRALDVTRDPNVALWFACHRAEKVEGNLRYTRSPESGYVYALWIPTTIASADDSGRSYRRAQRQGYRHGAESVSSPLEQALLLDLSASMMRIERDVGTRAVRQRAALLLGNQYSSWRRHHS